MSSKVKPTTTAAAPLAATVIAAVIDAARSVDVQPALDALRVADAAHVAAAQRIARLPADQAAAALAVDERRRNLQTTEAAAVDAYGTPEQAAAQAAAAQAVQEVAAAENVVAYLAGVLPRLRELAAERSAAADLARAGVRIVQGEVADAARRALAPALQRVADDLLTIIAIVEVVQRATGDRTLGIWLNDVSLPGIDGRDALANRRLAAVSAGVDVAALRDALAAPEAALRASSLASSEATRAMATTPVRRGWTMGGRTRDAEARRAAEVEPAAEPLPSVAQRLA